MAMVEFRRKIIDFGVFFWRSYVRCVEILKLEFRRKTIDSGVLFAAIMFGVSFFFRGGILATVSTVVIVAERRF